MLAAVDFVDKQQYGAAAGDDFVNGPQLMMDGVDRRLFFDGLSRVVASHVGFDRRQAADFPFLQEVAVDIDEGPVVFLRQLVSQGGLADAGLADEKGHFAGSQD